MKRTCALCAGKANLLSSFLIQNGTICSKCFDLAFAPEARESMDAITQSVKLVETMSADVISQLIQETQAIQQTKDGLTTEQRVEKKKRQWKIARIILAVCGIFFGTLIVVSIFSFLCR